MRLNSILWVGESSFLSSGFSTYSKEVLSRLHSLGKYKIHELGCYGSWKGDYSDIPWKFYPSSPNPDNKEEVERYNSNHSNQFGEWKFEDTCLSCFPDVVCDIRDWWYMEFQERSPFRRHYNWQIMPTVDAVPQDNQWISSYLNADKVLCYSDWGGEVLRNQTGGRINPVTASPAAESSVFIPVANRASHREAIGVASNALILGTVMRNQKRKLYPDLIQSFADYLKSGPEDITSRSYLYMHTSWPDVGWDIPRLINEAGIGSHILMTYVCRKCHAVYPAFYSGSRSTCRKCRDNSATFPNSAEHGIDRKSLNAIYNLFDLYVQYSNSEGAGLPAVEAALSGVPVAEVDYSAMSDFVRKLGGFPIPVQRLYREAETHCWRALPDNQKFVEYLIDFFQKPSPIRAAAGARAREAAKAHFSYDKAAEQWEKAFDELGVKTPWDAKPVLLPSNTNVPQNLSNEQFVNWGLVNIARRPDMVGSYSALKMVRDLYLGCSHQQTGGVYFNDMSSCGLNIKPQPFSREDAVKAMNVLWAQQNYWEGRRMQQVRGATP